VFRERKGRDVGIQRAVVGREALLEPRIALAKVPLHGVFTRIRRPAVHARGAQQHNHQYSDSQHRWHGGQYAHVSYTMFSSFPQT
jgi:hypothetical protein